MRSLLVSTFAVTVACGGAAGPTLAPVASVAPVTAPSPPVAPAATSCADASVLLRGTVEDEKQAGPAKEAVIAKACTNDHWSAEILACIGGAVTPTTCLERLSEDQLTEYDVAIADWTDKYGESDEDEYHMRSLASVPIDCASGIGDVAGYSPAVTTTGDSYNFVVSLRSATAQQLCEAGWSNSVKHCFDNGEDSDGCRAQLTAVQQSELTGKLAELEAFAGKIAALEKQPASIDCKHVATAYFGDTAGTLQVAPTVKPTKQDLARAETERKRLVGESRKLMTTACTQESWIATGRACLVLGGKERCWKAIGRPDPRWTFPAVGVAIRTGIAECDAFAASNAALLLCDKFPQGAKDNLRLTYEQQVSAWLRVTASERATFAVSCKQAQDIIRQTARGVGCAI